MKANDNIPAQMKNTEAFKMCKSLCDSLVESFNELPKTALIERYSFFDNLPDFTVDVIMIIKRIYGFGDESFRGFVFRIASLKNK